MTQLQDAKKIIDSYFDQVKEASKALSDLEARAQAVQDQGERQKAAYAEVRANETTVEGLRQERRELMRFFQEADFEGDVNRKSKITKRRLAIDSEVKKIEKEIDRLQGVAEENQPDQQEVAELAVALDALAYPNPYDFAEDLKKSLWSRDSELYKRRQTTKNVLPNVDASLYEKAKYGEKEYEMRQRVEALKQEEQAKKAEKLRDSIRRSELAGAPRGVDGRVFSAERNARLSDELDD